MSGEPGWRGVDLGSRSKGSAFSPALGAVQNVSTALALWLVVALLVGTAMALVNSRGRMIRDSSVVAAA